MHYINGDLLKGNWDVAAHVCNNHVVMGSGVAYYLSKKWPEVLKADEEFDLDEDNYGVHKMGKFSVATLLDNRKVFNLYAMYGIGCDENPLNRNCCYDKLHDALYKMCETLRFPLYSCATIGIPYLMGCCRAGGNWLIVEAILKVIEAHHDVEFEIYKLDEFEQKAQSTVKI